MSVLSLCQWAWRGNYTVNSNQFRTVPLACSKVRLMYEYQHKRSSGRVIGSKLKEGSFSKYACWFTNVYTVKHLTHCNNCLHSPHHKERCCWCNPSTSPSSVIECSPELDQKCGIFFLLIYDWKRKQINSKLGWKPFSSMTLINCSTKWMRNDVDSFIFYFLCGARLSWAISD